MSVAALAVALVFVLARIFAPDLLMRAVAPAYWLGDGLSRGASGIFGGFSDARILAEKNSALTQENAVLALENQTLRGDLADLGLLVGTTTRVGSAPSTFAGVLARPPIAPYDTLVLSVGTAQGAGLGMEAFGPGGVPLGIVRQVTANMSRVELFSAPGVATDAWVGDGRIAVTLRGAGAGAFTASVSQGSGIAVGDTVYLPGPGAVPMGRVAHIAGAASDPVAQVSVAPLVNPFSVTWVALVEASNATVASSTLSGSEP